MAKGDIKRGLKSDAFRDWWVGGGCFAAFVSGITSQNLVLVIVSIVVAAGYYGSKNRR